ncbi:hypothetical protein [Actinomadura sp. 21ATH]|uniref:hypothetical protein n=1 Tax=Actinomadura sp. 21ATH TaxID=1735444 RepID=UPI0035C1257F
MDRSADRETQLAALAHRHGWSLRSTAGHPGYTRTNLQSAGPSLGRDRPKRSFLNSLTFLPSQNPDTGAEPLLYAATGPGAANGGYYGPSGRFKLVGPTGPARLPRRAQDADATVRLWTLAQDLTGTHLAQDLHRP